jgi:hypothetical protein
MLNFSPDMHDVRIISKEGHPVFQGKNPGNFHFKDGGLN